MWHKSIQVFIYLVFILQATSCSIIPTPGFGVDTIDIRGEAPNGYDLNIVSIYTSSDSFCQKSDWNGGGRTYGITHTNEMVWRFNGKYYASFSKYLKKNFCSWDLAYTEIRLNYKKKGVNDPVKFNGPIYKIIIRPTRKTDSKSVEPNNSLVVDKFVCVRNDRITTKWEYGDEKIIDTGLNCRSKNSHLSNGNSERTISIDELFEKVSDIELDFKIKKDIYCFSGRRNCPKYAKIDYIWNVEKALDAEVGVIKRKPIQTHKYVIDRTKTQELFSLLDVDGPKYNMSQVKILLDNNSTLLRDPGYTLLQNSLVSSVAHDGVSFEALKLFTQYGYDISKYIDKHYLKKEVNDIILSFDIYDVYDGEYFYEDYRTLPHDVKEKLKENNITVKNYYSTKVRRPYLFIDIATHKGDEALKIMKWFLAHGYKAKKDEFERALVGALFYNDFKDTSKIVKEYIKLGANLKNPSVSFPLMDAMRSRHFGDIQTLKILVDAGVNINAADDEYGATILFSTTYKLDDKYRSMCSILSNKEIIKEYIKLGADVNHINKEGKSLLQTEEHQCNIDALRELGAK